MNESDEEHDITLRLEDILVFITGADCVPPMGFKTAPGIHFSHSSLKLALASTRAPSITLPTCHNSYEDSKMLWLKALLVGLGSVKYRWMTC